ncbi:unnamed protein product [Polarella glacialis]|uniref:Uncharacterized protein n=1 Tax=Polarella glacialis TaxID=89957 RepID=A0A813LR32_POLGL|nr:unnamed protein product [Polarella glacialis]
MMDRQPLFLSSSPRPNHCQVGKFLIQIGQITLGAQLLPAMQEFAKDSRFRLYATLNNACALQYPCQMPLVISLPLISTRVMSSDLPSSSDEAMAKCESTLKQPQQQRQQQRLHQNLTKLVKLIELR